MKKATKARMPSKAKAPTQKGKGQVNSLLDLLEDMDELALRSSITAALRYWTINSEEVCAASLLGSVS